MSEVLGVNTDVQQLSAPQSVSASFRNPPDYAGMTQNLGKNLSDIMSSSNPLERAGKEINKSIDTIKGRYGDNPVLRNKALSDARRSYYAEYGYDSNGRALVDNLFKMGTTQTVMDESGTKELDLDGNVISFTPNDMSPETLTHDLRTNPLVELSVNAPNFASTMDDVMGRGAASGHEMNPDAVVRIGMDMNNAFVQTHLVIDRFQATLPSLSGESYKQARGLMVNKIRGAVSQMADQFASPEWFAAIDDNSSITSEDVVNSYDAIAADYRQMLVNEGVGELVPEIADYMKAQREILVASMNNVQNKGVSSAKRRADQAKFNLSYLDDTYAMQEGLIGTDRMLKDAQAAYTAVQINSNMPAYRAQVTDQTGEEATALRVLEQASRDVTRRVGRLSGVQTKEAMNVANDKVENLRMFSGKMSTRNDVVKVLTNLRTLTESPVGGSMRFSIQDLVVSDIQPKLLELYQKQQITKDEYIEFLSDMDNYDRHAQAAQETAGYTDEEVHESVNTISPEYPLGKPSSRPHKDFLTEIIDNLEDQNAGKER